MHPAELPPFPVWEKKQEYEKIPRARQIELADRMRDTSLPTAERQAARNELLLSALPWLFNRCQRVTRNQTTHDEFQQTVLDSLAGLDEFDARVSSITSYVAKRAYWTIDRMRRNHATLIRRPNKHTVAGEHMEHYERAGLVLSINFDAPEEYGIEDCLASDETTTPEDIDRADELRRLREAIARLPERTREVLLSRLAGNTLQAVGDQLGLTREWVRQIEMKAYRMLRADLLPAAGAA